MRMAIDEAKKGMGRTSPNPCVGAVIVRDDRVVGVGHHKKAGTPHAEIHALEQAGEQARGATLYVTLEPCNHTGRTPPCSEMVARAGISRVVIGLCDPNPVASGGVQFLEQNGIQVDIGVCGDECRRLILPFLKHIRTRIPWVVLKAAASLDGRITYRSGTPAPISGPESRALVHRLRDQLDAILIGIQTLQFDNPSLTTRLTAPEQGRDPVRVILDSHLRSDPASRVFQQDSSAPTWVFCTNDAPLDRQKALETVGARVFRVEPNNRGQVDLKEMLSILGKHNILSLLVEGGATILGSFLAGQHVDEVYLFIAPFFIGDQGDALIKGFAVSGPESAKRLVQVECAGSGDDCLIHGYFQEPCVWTPTA